MTADTAFEFWTRFMPHGHCYLWRPDILWLNVISDAFISIAYFSIPLILFFFIRQRPSSPFRGMIRMFSIFILACGVTHLVGIWTVWHGDYGIQGLTKGVTALVSMVTAISLVPAMPRFLALKSPTELESLNEKLKEEVLVHKQTTERLQQAESQFRTFVEQAPDGVLIVDRAGNIKFANTMLAKQFAYHHDELVGKSVDQLVPAQLRDQQLEFRESYFDASHLYQKESGMEWTGLRKNHSEFPIEISFNPIESDGETVVLATVRDITERKSLEENTRKELLDLAHVSRLSTVGEMASGLAHELNQPLTAISQNCDTALVILRKQESASAELTEILEENYEYSQRAGEIIRGLRALVRKDGGKKIAGDVNELISATVKLISQESNAANVQIKLNLVDSLPKVILDETQIRQVLVNLTRNSLEALKENNCDSNQENRVLTISTQLRDNRRIKVSVHDNGPGIPPDIVDGLFKPYETTRQSGMGLGLAISRSIVEANGGRLWLDDKQDSGTTFHFTLPLVG